MGGPMLEGIVKEHSPEIFGYLCRYLGNRAAAEDVLGDVYVRLIEQHAKSKDDEFQWRPWLYRVATNLAISSLRRRKLFSLFASSERHEAQMTVQGGVAAEEGERITRMRAAIDTLGKRHKPVVLMRYYQDMSHEEIARSLDISVGTVKSRLNEARRRLEEVLSEENI
jgi:RNA polymerase sigma-70 factor (ECF subfamily)